MAATPSTSTFPVVFGNTTYGKPCDRVEGSIEETLTYYQLPLAHHKHMTLTDMQERLNQEINGRTHAVRMFRSAASCPRLVRAMAVETRENLLEAIRYLNRELYGQQKKEIRRQAT